MRKNWSFVFISMVMVSICTAQKTPHFGLAGAGKILFLDYGNPNKADSLPITNGLEFSAIKGITPWFNVVLPLKFSIARIPGINDNRNLFSLDVLGEFYYHSEKIPVIPFVHAGVGAVNEDIDKDGNIQFPLGVGLYYAVSPNSLIKLHAEYRASTAENRNNLQAGIGIAYRFQKKDKDGDGLADPVDVCPDHAGPRSNNGCPDRDQDGVLDHEDKCPDVFGPLAKAGCPDKDGDGFPDFEDKCPEDAGSLFGCPDKDGDQVADVDDLCPDTPGGLEAKGCPDSDGDGVLDNEDLCPNLPGIRLNAGCPAPDTDGDGVIDEMDKCPTEPGSKEAMGCPDKDNDGVLDAEDRCPDEAGSLASKGCPDKDNDGFPDKEDRCPSFAGTIMGCPDSDGDGIINPDDQCPGEAGPASNKGCPEIAKEVKETLAFAATAVQFETSRAVLKAESYRILDQVVDIMVKYPAYHLRIAGHTDNEGNSAANQVLSEERAKACYEYFVANDISPDRLVFIGYGESRPVADNNSEEGRRKNRRTEFELFIK